MQTLAQMCTIQIGHTVRGRLEAEAKGVAAIQLRDTRPEGGMAGGGIGRYRMDPVPDRYWVRPGDVLFRSRGDKNTATALGPEFPPAVAVMPLVILRPNPNTVDATYLAWWINQPAAQRHFDECAQGQNIRMIPIGCLSALKIAVPDIATQRTIAEVDRLSDHEYDLSTRLATRRRQLTAFALHERANRNSSNQNGASSKAVPHFRKQGDR